MELLKSQIVQLKKLQTQRRGRVKFDQKYN